MSPFRQVNLLASNVSWLLETWLQFWFGDAPKTESTDSHRDIANERIKAIQWLLYQGYIKRKKMRRARNEQEQCQRFVLWSVRYSGKFRALINLYPEWLDQFADSRQSRAKLMRTIAFHLYQ